MHTSTRLERQQRSVAELSRTPGNDRCADCFTRSPRWASFTLGIFLCASCASVHRRLSKPISQVKSVVHDTWTSEQATRMHDVGNIRSNKYYLPEAARFPPPTDVEPGEGGELDMYIRRKYEHLAFVQVTQQQTQKMETRMAHENRNAGKPTGSSDLLNRARPKTLHDFGSQNCSTPSPESGRLSLSTRPATMNLQSNVPSASSCPGDPALERPAASSGPQGVYADLLDLQDGPTLPTMPSHFPEHINSFSMPPQNMMYTQGTTNFMSYMPSTMPFVPHPQNMEYAHWMPEYQGFMRHPETGWIYSTHQM